MLRLVLQDHYAYLIATHNATSKVFAEIGDGKEFTGMLNWKKGSGSGRWKMEDGGRRVLAFCNCVSDSHTTTYSTTADASLVPIVQNRHQVVC